MALFNQMHYDQKWSLWDTWPSFGRNVRAYVITAASKLGRAITTQNRRANVITTQKRRANIIKAGG